MAVIICGKYGNNRSRTENVTERTRFSKSRSNYLEDIGQGQRSSHATHLLTLVIICIKYGKNPSRTVDATEQTPFSRSRQNDLEDIGQGQRSWRYKSRSKVIVWDTLSYGSDHLWLIWKESIQNCRCYRADTAGGADGHLYCTFDTSIRWS